MKMWDSLLNTATVVADPVLVDGSPMTGLSQVTDTDDSEVKVTDARSVDKPPYTPPGTNGTVTKCMKDHWEDSGKTSPLTCKAKEVYLTNIHNSNRTTCTAGTKLKVDISADIMFNTDRYDPTFFVALDGGDAMTGQCLLNGLQQTGTFIVLDNDSNSTTPVGQVVWDKDHRGGNDKCGDVIMNGGGGGKVRTTILNTEVLCVDRDKDGVLDVAVCFSWRVKGTDGYCTLTNDDPKTIGKLADAYPGTPSKCFCFVYPIDDITVDPVPDNRNDVCTPL